MEQFDNVANTGSGSTPGNVTFYSHGLAFRDPDKVDFKDQSGKPRTIISPDNPKLKNILVTSKDQMSKVTNGRSSADEVAYFVEALKTIRFTQYPWRTTELTVQYYRYNPKGNAKAFGFDWTTLKEGEEKKWPPTMLEKGPIVGVNKADKDKGSVQLGTIETTQGTKINIQLSPMGNKSVNELYYYACYSVALKAKLPDDLAKGRKTTAGVQTEGWFIVDGPGMKAILDAEFVQVSIDKVQQGDIMTIWGEADGNPKFKTLFHAAPVEKVK